MNKMIEHAMKTGTKKRPAPKHLKEFHAKAQHDGTYRMEKHSGKPGDTPQESTAPDVAGVQAALAQHMAPADPDGDAGADAAQAPTTGM